MKNLVIIAYILLLSTINSLDREISFFSDLTFNPYSYDFTNNLSVTGFSLNSDLSLQFIKHGISFSIDDIYRSINSNYSYFPKGATNELYFSIYYVYKPINQFYIKFGNHFTWNRQVIQFDERGLFSDNRLGPGINIDAYFLPIINNIKFLEFIQFSFTNKISLYLYNRNNSFQFGYLGNIRFHMIPYIKNINLYIDTGFEYLSHDSIAGKLDSIYFSSGFGIQFGNIWKNTKNKNIDLEKNIEEPKEDIVKIDDSKESVTNEDEKKLNKKSSFYLSLDKFLMGDIIRIKNIFFQSNSNITGKGLAMLEDIIDYCNDNQNIIILITSYAEDNIKSDEMIIKIAGNRSNILRNYMINKGISGDRIKRSTSALTYDISKGLEPFIEIKILKK